MSFWSELKRRKVFKVGATYVIVAWLIVQVSNTFFSILLLPNWAVTLVAALLILGFPVTIIIAWAFELTPDGVKRSESVPVDESVTHVTGQKLNYILIGVIVLAIAYILFDNYFLDRRVVQTGEAKTIAVLPFSDLSPEKDQEYFTYGLSEELFNSLEKIPNLRVIAKASSFAFKEANKTAQEIAGAIGADHLLDGSVRKSGDDLRITAQLIRASDGIHIWSDIYDRKLEDIFDVQQDIAKAVCNALKMTLGIDNTFKTLGNTDNAEAYALYLVAKGKMGEPSVANYCSALESIDSAIEIDPEFALAWAWKAFIHIYLSLNDSEELVTAEQESAQQAALKAIELEPNLAEAHLSLDWMKTASLTINELKELSYQLEASEEELEVALAQLSDELTKKSEYIQSMEKMPMQATDDPYIRKMNQAAQRARQQVEYEELFKELNLSPEKKKSFLDILVDRDTAYMDNALWVGTKLTEEEREEMQKRNDDINSEYEKKLRELLGNDDYNAYEEYEKRWSARQNVDKLNEMLDENEKMTETERKKLIDVMHEAWMNYYSIYDNEEPNEEPNEDQEIEYSWEMSEEDIARSKESMIEVNELYVEAARDLLSDSQIEKLIEMFEKEVDDYERMMRLQINQNAYFHDNQ